ncbi:MAG: 4Fe-4S dicluster domain-containing protein [Deltaproteobacteria bacterium]|nr:4Fe-4S dicluster domain-containing protein [Deltaproteobacteria bacterium]
MKPPKPARKHRGADSRIVLAEQDRFLARDIDRLSGANLNRCFHCRSCGSGCPFIRGMDYPPNGVIRLVQYGLRRQALESHTIWICVGCHTCSVQCPMGIDIAAVMATLRRLALEEGAMIAETNILDFHREVLHSIKQYGRAHKLGIMLRYKARVRQWFADLDVGLRMLAKRKMDLRASRVQAIGEITRLFIPHWKR